MLGSEPVWPWSTDALRAHLAGCEACRGYYDQGVLVLRAARGVADAPGTGELERMMRRAEAGALEVGTPRSKARVRARWVIAAAMLALGVWVFARSAPEVGVVVTAVRLVIDGEEARAGAKIAEGQDVVASGGSAVVRLNGGRLVLIQEGSRLRFGDSGARASIESGGGYFRVEKGMGRFEVTAGSATVVVKGTEFLVERKDLTTTTVVVDEGLVEVRTRTGSVQVGAAQQATVSGESVPVIRETDLLERIRRGLQRFGKELDRAVR